MEWSAGRVALGAILVVVGGTGAAYATGVIQKPDVGITDKGDWVTDDDVIRVRSSAYVANANPVGFNLSTFDARYMLKMNGVELAEGTKSGLHIPRYANRTLAFTSELETGNIPRWWVSHLNNDETSALKIPVNVDLVIGSIPLSFGGFSYTDSIATDIEGVLDDSLSELEGRYTRDIGAVTGLSAATFELEVVDASARFGDVDSEHTVLVIPLTLKNVNSYPIPTPQMRGELTMNGVTIAGFDANNVETSSDTNIPPGETRDVTVKAEMSNQNLDEWFESHVRKGEKTDAELDIRFGFDIGDTQISVPSDDGMRCRFSFSTAILVDTKREAEGFGECTGIVRGSDDNGSGDDGENATDGGLPGL